MVCKDLPPLSSSLCMSVTNVWILLSDWCSRLGCDLLPMSEQDWNTPFLIFFLLNLAPVFSILVTTLPLWLYCFVSTERIIHPEELLDKCVTPLSVHWFFQRAGGKAMHDPQKWVLSARKSGIRGRRWGDVFERGPPRRLVHYHKSICPCFFYILSQRLNHSSTGLAVTNIYTVTIM